MKNKKVLFWGSDTVYNSVTIYVTTNTDLHLAGFCI